MSGYAHSGLEAYASGIEATLGDLQSLQSRKRRALRLHIAGDILAGLRLVAPAVGA